MDKGFKRGEGLHIVDSALGKIHAGASTLTAQAVPNYAGNILQGSSFLRKVIIPFDIFRGQRFYKKYITKS
ncbi:MAG: hypothetical protein PQJ46_16500 [Spirochaetales bacterium]|nr:hypothetical protein [Spirochaetales bacterium]